MKRIQRVMAVSLVLMTIFVADTALATVYTHVGKGVGGARIKQTYTYAAKQLSGTYRTSRDKSYSYTVYHTYVGKKMSNGRYPIELYSKADKKVFRFQVNSSRYPTTKAVKIGSTEKYVRSKYPSAKGPYTSGSYRRYTLKHSIYSFTTYTDFYCKSGKVAFIIVRR